MARTDEISSTEKLLDLIRGNTVPATPSRPVESTTPVPQKRSLFSPLRFNKSTGIGVEIGNHAIKIAKISRVADKSFVLLDYDSIPMDETVHFDSPQLAKTLATMLARFTSGLARYDIWCCVASAKVETRCIRIPKLPKKQIPNAVFWTFSKEVSFSEKEMLLDFRLLGDVKENGMTKTQVMTFTIPIAETDALKRLFARTGFPLAGVSIVPFAIQNLLKTEIIEPMGSNTCCLFIGRDWSRITIYANGDLVLSRGIKAGMHSMVDAIAGRYRRLSTDEAPSELTMESANGEDAVQKDFHYQRAQESFFRFLDADQEGDAAAVEDEIAPDDLFEAILPAIERLVRQVERTVSHFSLHFNRSGVDEIYVSGKVTGSRSIIDHIESQMDVPVQVLNPLPQPHPFTQQVQIPEAPAEKESYVPAIGIGLSSNSLTPNFLHTYRDREKSDRARSVRIGIASACIALLVMLLVTFIWQENRLSAKSEEAARLTSQRDAFNIPLTKELVMGLYAKVTDKRKQIDGLSRRYHSSAVMSEVCRRTPEHIQLIAVEAEMGDEDPKDQNNSATLAIEGVILGEQIRFETDLASYMFRMEASLLFDKPVVSSKQIQLFRDQPALRFTIRMTML